MRLRWILLLILIQSVCWGESSASRDVVSSNQQAMESLQKQEFHKAQNQLTPALRQDPFNAELQYNLGLAFDGAGAADKAKQAYEQATKHARDAQAKFASEFNLGELAGREKKVDEALLHYQAALEAKPDSVEAKTNIEMLIQQQQEDQKNKDQKKDDKNKDQKKDKNKDQNQDKKEGDGNKDQQPKSDQGQDDQEKNQHHAQPKPQPQQFKSQELSQGDVKKILEELDRQEQRVRAEFNKKQVKERPRDKDW